MPLCGWLSVFYEKCEFETIMFLWNNNMLMMIVDFNDDDSFLIFTWWYDDDSCELWLVECVDVNTW